MRDGNIGVLHIPQSSSITGPLLSDCLVSYPGHSLEESYSSTEMQLVYSAAPANCTNVTLLNMPYKNEMSVLFSFLHNVDVTLPTALCIWKIV